MHFFIRIFVNLEHEGVDTANCDQGCGFGTELLNGATGADYACSSFAADYKLGVSLGANAKPADEAPPGPFPPPAGMCVNGTEVLMPPSCARNETSFLSRRAYANANDYAGNPRQWWRV